MQVSMPVVNRLRPNQNLPILPILILYRPSPIPSTDTGSDVTAARTKAFSGYYA